MMLYGKKIKFFCVLLFVFSFLFLACCNKKSVENKNSTTQQVTKQAEEITEKVSEKNNTELTEKEELKIKDNDVITTIINNSKDNEIPFDAIAENDSISMDLTTTIPVTTICIQNEITSQAIQIITEPATDTDGWVTKWY